MNEYEYSKHEQYLISKWHLLCREEPKLLEAENIIRELLEKNTRHVPERYRNASDLFYSVYFDWKALISNSSGWEHLKREDYQDWPRALVGWHSKKLDDDDAYLIAIQYLDILWEEVLRNHSLLFEGLSNDEY